MSSSNVTYWQTLDTLCQAPVDRSLEVIGEFPVLGRPVHWLASWVVPGDAAFASKGHYKIMTLARKVFRAVEALALVPAAVATKTLRSVVSSGCAGVVSVWNSIFGAKSTPPNDNNFDGDGSGN